MPDMPEIDLPPLSGLEDEKPKIDVELPELSTLEEQEPEPTSERPEPSGTDPGLMGDFSPGDMVDKPDTSTEEEPREPVEPDLSSIGMAGLPDRDREPAKPPEERTGFEEVGSSLLDWYSSASGSLVSTMTGADIEDVREGGADFLPDEPQQSELAWKIGDIAGDIGGNLVHLGIASQTLGAAGTGAQLSSPQIAQTVSKIPNAIKAGLSFGSSWTGRKAISDVVNEEEFEPADYVETFLKGTAAGTAGHGATNIIRDLSTEVPIPRSIYPIVEKTSTGAIKGGAMTGVEYAFDPDDTELSDLGLNMATMALWNNMSMLTRPGEYEQINQARDYLSEQKELTNMAYQRLGIEKPENMKDVEVTRNYINNVRNKIINSSVSDQFNQLSPEEQNFLIDKFGKVMLAADYAEQHINNMPIADRAKVLMNSDLKNIFTNTTSDVFASHGIEAVYDVSDMEIKPETRSLPSPERPDLQEAQNLLTTFVDNDAIRMPGETPGEGAIEEPIAMPGETPQPPEEADTGEIEPPEIEFDTVQIQKPLEELTEEDIGQIEQHLQGKLEAAQETDEPVIGGEEAIRKDLETIRGLKGETAEPVEEAEIEDIEGMDEQDIEEGEPEIEVEPEPEIEPEIDENFGEYPDEELARRYRDLLEEQEMSEQRMEAISGNEREIEAIEAEIDRRLSDETLDIDLFAEESATFTMTPDLIKEDLLERQNNIMEQGGIEEEEPVELPDIEPVAGVGMDSERITPELLSEFTPSEEGLIDTATNRDFVTDYLDQVVGAEQKEQYLDENGNLSQEGQSRIKAGIFNKAYGDTNIEADLLESTDSTVQNITTAMVEVAPQIVDTQERITRGELYDLDISGNLTNAAELYKDITVGEADVEEGISQADMTGERYSPVEKELVRVFEDHKYSRKKIRDIITEYNRLIVQAGRADMDGLFDEAEAPSKVDLLQQARQNIEGEPGQATIASKLPDRKNYKEHTVKVDMSDTPTEVDEVEMSIDAPYTGTSLRNVGQFRFGGERPIDMPEIVEIAKAINDGKYPHIVKQFRDRATQGRFVMKDDKGHIELRADIFIGPIEDSVVVKSGEVDEAISILEEEYPGEEFQIEQKKEGNKVRINVYRKDPTYAGKVLAHEIGHVVDWIPDKDIARGNILGRIKSLKNYMKQTIESGTDQGELQRNDIMAELKQVTQYWKPFNPEEASEKYLKYRYSSRELYADALSMLTNEPTTLQEMAPTFYRAFMDNLDRKPEFKAVYEDIQRRLNNRAALNDERLETVYQSHEKGREKRREMLEEAGNIESAQDWLARMIVDKNHYVLKTINDHFQDEGAAGELAREARNNLEELPYLSSEIEDFYYYAGDILETATEDGIELKDMSVYLQERRIITDRTDIANPEGHAPDAAEEQLARLETKMGEEKYNRMAELAGNLHELWQERVVARIEESGMYPQELVDHLKDNREYVPFNVIKYMDENYGDGIGGGIYRQYGTLSEIEDPIIALLTKGAELLASVNINEAKHATAIAFRNLEPGTFQEAPTDYDGNVKRHVPVKPKDKDKKLFTFMIDGDIAAYHVPKEIAEVFEKDEHSANAVGRFLTSVTQFFKNLYVSRNLRWQLFNVPRDMMNTIINNPEVDLKDIPHLLTKYKEAYKEAWNEVMRGERSEDISEMRRQRMLTIQRMFQPREKTEGDEVLNLTEQILNQVDPEAAEEQNFAAKQLKKVWDFLSKTGQVSELGGQLAGYKYLTDETDLEEGDLGHRIRTRVGTPDFKRQGAGQRFTNSLFMFSNVRKEGWRASKEAFKDDPGKWMWKRMLLNVLPKLLQIAAGFAAFIPFLKDKLGWASESMDGASEYEKRNYTTVPLFVDDKLRSHHLLLPQDFIGQSFSSIIYDMAHGNFTGQGSAVDSILQQNPYSISSLNPMAKFFAIDMTQYTRGRNIPDFWRGGGAISEEAMITGGWDKHKEALMYEFGQLGGRAFIDPNIQHSEDWLQGIMNVAPFNSLTRFYNISDYGYEEDINELYKKQNELDTIVSNAERELSRGKEPSIGFEEYVNKESELKILQGYTEPIGQLTNMMDLLEEGNLPEGQRERVEEKANEEGQDIQTMLKKIRYDMAREYLGKEPLGE